MTYPKYDFTDVTLDYSLVYATVILMYSDLTAQGSCCASTSIQKSMSEANLYITAANIDVDDTIRYKADVKSAYLTLYSLT